MPSSFVIAQFLTVSTPSQSLRFQNYFVGRDYSWNGNTYVFSGFQIDGSQTSGAENSQISILFPNTDVSLNLLEVLDGARLSQIRVDSVWYVNNTESQVITDYYTGVGSSFDETTIEVRCRSAIDSVVSGFPRRQLNDELVGILPQLNEIRLQ